MTKRMIVVMMTLVLCAAAAMAEDPYQVAWTAQIGTSSDDASKAVAVDAAGNTYISGYTYGSLGGTSEGDIDTFLTKFDASGNELWSRQIGTSGYDHCSSVAVDADGNAYISGSTEGSLEGTNAGGLDAFLIKFDAAGNELWRQQIGTASGDGSYSVAVDAYGNPYISGRTYGNIGGTNAGGADAFLIKFDSSGNALWSQQIGTASHERSSAVAVDADGNAYISGHTGGSLGGTSAGNTDPFLTKFDAAGNELWRQQIGTASTDYGEAVAVDAAGNAYITGSTAGDLGGTNAGAYDAYLTKFDTAGNVLWTQLIGTSSTEFSYAVAVDAFGNVYISGRTKGSLGGTNAGGYDAFLVKYEVPEPATLSLLALGACLPLFRRKTR